MDLYAVTLFPRSDLIYLLSYSRITVLNRGHHFYRILENILKIYYIDYLSQRIIKRNYKRNQNLNNRIIIPFALLITVTTLRITVTNK